ncbi:MAG: hypothetical protein IPM50_02720 [Acidobacteriota bacterium]|nr:MAG: hypothetical protein IPM50_02720 [Acidobacteriota bacterium]
MSDTESKLIDDEKIEWLRSIFDPDRKLESDDDLIELSKMLNDESDDSEFTVDYDHEFE